MMSFINKNTRRLLAIACLALIAGCAPAAKNAVLDMAAPAPIKTISGKEVTLKQYRAMDAARKAAFDAEFAGDVAAKEAWEKKHYRAGSTVTAGNGKTKIEATRIAALDHTIATMSTDTGFFGADMTDVVMLGAQADGSVATKKGEAVVTQSHQLAQEKFARVVVDRSLQVLGGAANGSVTQLIGNLTKCAGGCPDGPSTTWNLSGGNAYGGQGGDANALTQQSTKVSSSSALRQSTAGCTTCKGGWGSKKKH